MLNFRETQLIFQRGIFAEMDKRKGMYMYICTRVKRASERKLDADLERIFQRRVGAALMKARVRKVFFAAHAALLYIHAPSSS